MFNLFTLIILLGTIALLIITCMYNEYQHKKECDVLYRLIKVHHKVIDQLEEDKDDLKKEIFLLKSKK